MSAVRPDYYAQLGLARHATAAEIRAAYRHLALELRPDLDPSPQWQLIATAYKVLGDQSRRALYDQGLDPYVRRPHHLERVGAWAASVTSALGLDRPPARPRGTDVIIQVPVPSQHTIRYRRYAACRDCHASGLAEGGDWVTCGHCRGVGEYQRRRLVWLGGMSLGWLVGGAVCGHCQGRGVEVRVICPACQGSGRVVADESLRVFIPIGRRWIRVRHMGNAGSRGGSAGDLLVIIGSAALPEAARVGLVGATFRWLTAYAKEFRP